MCMQIPLMKCMQIPLVKRMQIPLMKCMQIALMKCMQIPLMNPNILQITSAQVVIQGFRGTRRRGIVHCRMPYQPAMPHPLICCVFTALWTTKSHFKLLVTYLKRHVWRCMCVYQCIRDHPTNGGVHISIPWQLPNNPTSYGHIHAGLRAFAARMGQENGLPIFWTVAQAKLFCQYGPLSQRKGPIGAVGLQKY